MFNPAPSIGGPSGSSEISLAPPRYNGNGGPGTLEITRLIGTGPRLASPPSSRLASPKLRGPASSPRSMRVRARADRVVLLFRTLGRVAAVRDLLVDVVEVGRQRHEHRRDPVPA